jgi:hypothetical protein
MTKIWILLLFYYNSKNDIGDNGASELGDSISKLKNLFHFFLNLW